MENFPEPAFVDELLGECHRRDPAIVVPHHVRHLRRLHCFAHFLPLGGVHAQWLFTQDHLSRLGRGQCDFLVRVVRRADIDRINVRPGDQLFPIRLDRFVTPLVSEFFCFGCITTASGFQHRLIIQLEKIADPLVTIGMRPAHEAVTDHADVQIFLCHAFPRY